VTAAVGVFVQTNLAELFSYLDKAARKQVPFATAVALTRLAQAGQTRYRSELPKKFELRSAWTQRGILIKPARRSDWPNVRSEVGSRDDYMAMQEEGGTKRPRKARNLSLPGKRFARKLRGASGRIPSSRRPKQLLAKKKTYYLTQLQSGKSKGMQAILKRRKGAHDRTRDRVVYIYRPQGKIRPRADFRPIVTRRAQELYGPIFDRVLRQALATPKKPRLR
jgi:hypothetical protein